MTREKQLTTGKAVFDVEFALLHQQREMSSLKTRMDVQGDKMDKIISMLERLADKVALPLTWGNLIAMTASGWCW